ncbi:MAG: NlpC/P60 family protein [Candidimonas sp.]|nr:MAG: NlpC/P60 family protein [Candidimonas sp.]
MPPHRLDQSPAPDPHPPTSTHLLWRTAKLVILASSLALAGCATSHPPTQSASARDAFELHLRAERNSYLQQTKSDPLGAYLADAQNDNLYSQAITYSRNGHSRSGTRGDQGLANVALDFLGVKYRYGGDAPSTGFDCSGLVAYAAEKSLGLKLPHHSAALAREGKPVKRRDLKKGDLVFFNTLGKRYSHVGIYLGHDKFVHAPRSGLAIRIEDMDQSYWKKRYTGARRLVAHNNIRQTSSR